MNPAKRVLPLIQRAAETHPSNSHQALNTWQLLLFPSEATDKVDSIAIARQLGQVDDQIELIIQQLTQKSVPPSLLKPLRLLRQAVSPMHLNQPWQSVCARFREETIHCLDWSAFVLDDTEEPVDPEEIDKLVFQLDELEEALQQIRLPENLRSFIAEHLKHMREAASAYSVTGIAPLRKAYESFVGSVMIRSDELKEATSDTPDEGNQFLRQVGNVVKTVENTVNRAAKVTKNAFQLKNTADQAMADLGWNGISIDGA